MGLQTAQLIGKRVLKGTGNCLPSYLWEQNMRLVRDQRGLGAAPRTKHRLEILCWPKSVRFCELQQLSRHPKQKQRMCPARLSQD